MTSTVYSHLSPPVGGSADGEYQAEGGFMTAPLTRENITLLQALSQPSRLRTHVTPNFEVVSWGDPDFTPYNLSDYRPPRSDGAAPGVLDRGERRPNGAPVGGRGEGASHNGEGCGGDASGPGPRQGRGRQNGVGLRDEQDERPRQYPERPPPPLPSSRQRQPWSASNDAQLYPHRSDSCDYDYAHDSEYDDGDDDEISEVGIVANASNVPRSREAPSTVGRLDMRALEEQFTRVAEPAARQAGGIDEKGNARREDLPRHDIYASLSQDDLSYTKRPAEKLPSQFDGQCTESDDASNVDGSRPPRFEESRSVRERGSLRGERRGSSNADIEDYDESERFDNPRNERRPLRDTWERPRSDGGSDRHPRCGYNTTSNYPPSAPHYFYGQSNEDDTQNYNPYYSTHDIDEGGLRDDLVSYDNDNADLMEVPSHRRQLNPPRRPQPPPPAPAMPAASQNSRRSAPSTIPPHAAPISGCTYLKGPLVYSRHEEKTVKQKQRSTQRNPKAFQNRTTHSWITTNTTTTLVLPATTVQLVPLSRFSPVVEEMPTGERWASQPFLLSAPRVETPGGAGYQHRPSQMTVLDDSEDVTVTDSRGYTRSLLPQLQRQARASANNTKLRSSMPDM
ncbi:hypothetical protein ABL78_5979 [Leptomonas seymouri]|uniref:Uncharacterized protein n=1 Tax=Leptomonas seymouri TaxID=5684 RepID=A0A0N1PAA6_LEPSE|nr:hypothetical protein ABL78_5979 [Leptomonas seymouri]|eukprot:KPI84964.1 hypothetical protein ABL78_5979 [Leptomonas seymouri]